MSEFFNDNGVPHGAFIASFLTAGLLKVEGFNVNDPSKIVNRPDEVGSPNGWAGVNDQMTATGTVQIPTSAGSSLNKGDYFTAAAAFGGAYKWVVVSKQPAFRMGEYWKEEVTFQRSYFS